MSNRKEYILPNGKKAVFEYDVCGIGKITLECMDELMSAIADRPQGEWIIHSNGKMCDCSACNESYDRTFEYVDEWNFCPNCGAINVSEHQEHPCRCCVLSKDICKIAFTDECKHCIYIKGKE